MMEPTICRRCGGLIDLCECAALRREGMMMAGKELAAAYRARAAAAMADTGLDAKRACAAAAAWHAAADLAERRAPEETL